MKAEPLTASHTPSQNQRAPAPSPGPSPFQYEPLPPEGKPQQEGPEEPGFPTHPLSVTGPSSFFPLRTIGEGKALREWAMNATLEELEDNIIFSEYMHDIEGVHIMRIVLKERTRR